MFIFIHTCMYIFIYNIVTSKRKVTKKKRKYFSSHAHAICNTEYLGMKILFIFLLDDTVFYV